MRAPTILAAALLAVVGCSDSQARTAQARARVGVATDAVSPGRVVDSAIPVEESLRRFRLALRVPSRLEGGAPSREELVRRLLRALERRDTAAVRRMALTAEEFAWLYYPGSRFSRPPYELPPDLMWFQIRGQSERGASRLLSRRGGWALRYLGHACDSVRTEGENRIHGPCAVRRLTAEGDTATERLFGLILERGGRYKYVTYANGLD